MSGANDNARARVSREVAGMGLAVAAEALGSGHIGKLLADASFDSVAPGYCVDCGFVAEEIEPDQEEGWCENCNGNSVVSVLVLAGLI